MKKNRFAILCIIGLLSIGSSQAQSVSQELTVSQKQKIIKQVGELIKARYIFPKTADKMFAYIEKQQQNNKYASIKSAEEFGRALTLHLIRVSKDKHIRLAFDPRFAKHLRNLPTSKPDPKLIQERKARDKSLNYGFEKVERLKGNVGYLDLRGFFDPEIGAKTVANAFGFLANTEGIIVDLRKNGGGAPKMVRLICSYFFGEKPIQLNGFYWRKGNRKEEYWTLKKIEGKRMPNKPLYILTSKRTFSAAEDFSYNMQVRKRATIIGETTGGGAHPVNTFPVGDRYVMAVPVGRSINPITKSNWEGVGVIPHIKVPANEAFDRAYLEMLKLLKKSGSSAGIEWTIQGLEAKIHPVDVSIATLKTYAGDYTNRRIILKDGQLYYQRPGISQHMRKLKPITTHIFEVEGLPFFRIQFKKDVQGKVIEVVGMYEDGHRNTSKRGSL